MFKNWSKVVLVSMLIVVVAASISFATTARVRSLANTGDYYSDDSAVNRWLSTLPSYANQVGAEVGSFSGQGSLGNTRGLSWSFRAGDAGTYRLTINENALDNPGFWIINPFYTVFSPGNAGPNTGVGATPINRWDLAGGWEFGENMALGVNYTRSSWSSDIIDPDPDMTTRSSNTWTTVGAGFSWSDNEAIAFDALLNVGFLGGEFDAGPVAGTEEWDSKTSFDLAARLFYDWKDNVTVPIKAEYISADYSRKDSQSTIPLPNGDKTTAFQFGVGINMDVNQGNMFIMAIEWTRMTWEYSNPDTLTGPGPGPIERTITGLPTIRMALESSINSWLTTRVGAARHQYKVTDKDGVQEAEYTDGSGVTNPLGGSFNASVIDGQSAFEWFLGIGINLAEWTIDMELSEDTPFSLGYWVTGYTAFSATNEGPVGRISATYNY
ncbi:MAG: hypothetical protein IH969_02590 [Candidatus Krumholzibacteriota bacterium]|nr:hypothetical protein [Candidatus Krumholzibacteriota bacterium]